MRASGPRGAGLRAALAVAGTSVLMVLIAWGTLIGPSAVFTGPGPMPGTVSPSTSTTSPPIEENQDDVLQDMVEQTVVPLWVKILVWVLEFCVLLSMIAFLGYVLVQFWRLWSRRPRSDGKRDEVGFDTLDEPQRIAAAMTADAAEQDAALHDGDARNAIVATWLRFEVQGRNAGMARQSWETSSEYAVRMLDRVKADDGAVIRLERLYREARFSDHSIDESHREAALTALGQIRLSLGVRS